ncbi:CHASE domain-containing protein [Novispirillum sp. DQ9]|uniref:CHASE domain-containing protein n=1 Tax=Novispirillum sp. DQ9 TaxID=3398612 RepID=UPI003C7CCA63
MGNKGEGAKAASGLLTRAMPVVASAIGALLTLWVWRMEVEATARLADLDFDRQAHQIERAVLEHLRLGETILNAAQGYMAGSDSVTIGEWNRFAAPFDLMHSHPGLDGLVYYSRVRHADLPDFVARQRDLWGDGFRVRNPGVAPVRDHLVVTLAEPAARVEAVIGLDIAGEAVRRAAAWQAAATGKPVLSDVLRLMTPGASGRDMIYMAPVYEGNVPPDTPAQRREALAGIVALGYGMERALTHVLEPFTAALAVRVEDRPGRAEARAAATELVNLGFDSLPAGQPRRILNLEVGGRAWTVHLARLPGAALPGTGGGRGLLIPLGGLFLSGLLGLAVWLLTTRRARAEALAAEMTHALARSEERYRQLFVRNRAVELLIDPGDGTLVDANEAAARFYGWSVDTLRTMRISDINTLDPDQVRAEMARAEGEQRDHFFFRHRLASGDVRDVEVRTGPIDDGARRLLYSIVHDVTERKVAEQALVDTLRDLERSNAELEQFAYIASHDLQEPLRMVSSYLGLIRRRYDDRLDEEGREFIAFAVDGAHRMQALINDLLVYSRVGRMGHPFAPVDLGRVLDGVAATLQVALEEAGGVLTRGPLPTVMGDGQELERLLQNLVGNALKYHRPGEPPRVDVRARRDGKAWRVTVTDNGIGIAPEFSGRIFLIFQRLHTQGEYSGTGIGLAVCKKIVERHQGTIGVSSVPGEGAAFWFTIPALEDAAGGAPSRLQAPAAPDTSGRLVSAD